MFNILRKRGEDLPDNRYTPENESEENTCNNFILSYIS
jgi:hypothetical protein